MIPIQGPFRGNVCPPARACWRDTQRQNDKCQLSWPVEACPSRIRVTPSQRECPQPVSFHLELATPPSRAPPHCPPGAATLKQNWLQRVREEPKVLPPTVLQSLWGFGQLTQSLWTSVIINKTCTWQSGVEHAKAPSSFFFLPCVSGSVHCRQCLLISYMASVAHTFYFNISSILFYIFHYFHFY